jgi:hypothetical protein
MRSTATKRPDEAYLLAAASSAAVTSPLVGADQTTISRSMTLGKAKLIARHLGLTLRQVSSGDYRVNFRDGNEATAYYTDSLDDAIKTAVRMARRRSVVSTPTKVADAMSHRRTFR